MDCDVTLPYLYLNIGNSSTSWFTVKSTHFLRDISKAGDKSVCGLRFDSNINEKWILGWPAMAGYDIIFDSANGIFYS